MDERDLNKKLVEIGKRKDLVVTDPNITKDNKTSFEGDFKARKVEFMPSKEKGFSQTQINQVIEIIHQTVPPIVKSIIMEVLKEFVIPRFEALEKDVAKIKTVVNKIKSCPTIQKELKE